MVLAARVLALQITGQKKIEILGWEYVFQEHYLRLLKS